MEILEEAKQEVPSWLESLAYESRYSGSGGARRPPNKRYQSYISAILIYFICCVCRHLGSRVGIVMLGICVSVYAEPRRHAALVLAVKVMHCCLVFICFLVNSYVQIYF